jgi:hypothetical protein
VLFLVVSVLFLVVSVLFVVVGVLFVVPLVVGGATACCSTRAHGGSLIRLYAYWLSEEDAV